MWRGVELLVECSGPRKQEQLHLFFVALIDIRPHLWGGDLISRPSWLRRDRSFFCSVLGEIKTIRVYYIVPGRG